MANKHPKTDLSEFNSHRTPKERSEIGRAGGLASARKRQERKAMSETLDIALKIAMKPGRIDSLAGIECLEDIKAKGLNLSSQDLIIVALLKRSLKGDVKAIELIRDMVGEKNAPSTVSPINDIAEEIRMYKEADA